MMQHTKTTITVGNIVRFGLAFVFLIEQSLGLTCHSCGDGLCNTIEEMFYDKINCTSEQKYCVRSKISFYNLGTYQYYYDGQCASVNNQYSIVNDNYLYTFYFCESDYCNALRDEEELKSGGSDSGKQTSPAIVANIQSNKGGDDSSQIRSAIDSSSVRLSPIYSYLVTTWLVSGLLVV